METPAPALARLRPLDSDCREEVRALADLPPADLPDERAPEDDPAADFDSAARPPRDPADLDAPEREEEAREDEARDPEALAPLLRVRLCPRRLDVSSAGVMSEASPVPDAARCVEASPWFCLRPCDAPERALPPDFLAPVAAIVHSLPFRRFAVVSPTVSRPHGSACEQLQQIDCWNCILHAALP